VFLRSFSLLLNLKLNDDNFAQHLLSFRVIFRYTPFAGLEKPKNKKSFFPKNKNKKSQICFRPVKHLLHRWIRDMLWCICQLLLFFLNKRNLKLNRRRNFFRRKFLKFWAGKFFPDEAYWLTLQVSEVRLPLMDIVSNNLPPGACTVKLFTSVIVTAM